MPLSALFLAFYLFFDDPKTSYLGDASSREGHNDSNHIYSELKLKELGDAVIDIPAPHHGLYDAAKVIVCQDDVGCLFSNVCACNALQNAASKS